ncbi:MAG: toxin-antitoxin system YwqK family antitoxin [Elusimicrobiaceae bacterium]|nr:toxin-antitoxin system YwqK family antitoxin [Elusimicrobiaceae bacterium]
MSTENFYKPPTPKALTDSEPAGQTEHGDVTIRKSMRHVPLNPSDRGELELVYYRGGREVARETVDENSETILLAGLIPDGPVKEYQNGQLFFEGNYANSQPHGLTRYYFENGKPEIEKNYKHGMLDGRARVYHENGQLRLETVYADGKRNGIQRKYYESGRVREDGCYANGHKDGLIRIYAENGLLVSAIIYKNGNADGLAQLYHESGKQSWEVPYCGGMPEGIAKRFNTAGILIEEWYYVRGEVVCKRKFNARGKIVTDWNLDAVKRAKIIEYMASSSGNHTPEEDDA